jgi:RNA polymerase sigma factor (TIGR02999 family)
MPGLIIRWWVELRNRLGSLMSGTSLAEGDRNRKRQAMDDDGGKDNHGTITALLEAWSRGDEEAGQGLMDLTYPVLRSIAARALARQAGDATLEATELAHEAYLRLTGQRPPRCENRIHFYALASRVMRLVLVDHARKMLSDKRGGGARHITLEAARRAGERPRAVEVLALDQALTRLAEIDKLAAQVVEVRYFSGLSVDETADVLHVGRTTVVRKWRYARAFLRDTLER